MAVVQSLDGHRGDGSAASWEKFLRLVRELLLEVRPNVLYSSLLYAFLATVFLCAKAFQSLDLDLYRMPALDSLVRFFDLGIIQLISVLLFIWLAVRYFTAITTLGKLVVALVIASVLGIVIGGDILIEQLFLKPSFTYSHTSVHSHPSVPDVISSVFGLKEPDDNSAPSGFVLRQTIILLNFLLLSHQKRWRSVFTRTQSRLLHWLQYGFFGLVSIVRVYYGRHALFDVGVAIGIATILFWCVVLSVDCMFRGTVSSREYIREAFVPIGTCAMALIFYCQETKWWLILFMFVFGGLAALEGSFRYRGVKAK
jgi:hypothetical protein